MGLLGGKECSLPSNIKQSFRSGLKNEFVWMHLDKDPTSLLYTPAANNAVGLKWAELRSGVSGGTLVAGPIVNHTTAKDEVSLQEKYIQKASWILF